MSRSKKETLQGEKRMQGEKRKDVKDKLWKDVEEKKKNFFNIFFFGEHITKSKNIDEYGNKSARIYTLCKAALA